MTKVGQLFEQEKLNYAEQYAKEYAKEQQVRLLVGMIDSGIITEEEAAKSLKCDIDEFVKLKKSILQLV